MATENKPAVGYMSQKVEMLATNNAKRKGQTLNLPAFLNLSMILSSVVAGGKDAA
jgi:hypothetical protein